MCCHWACLSVYLLSKLDEDYLYMAYADIMAKVSSCLCPASVPFSPDAASHKPKGLLEGGQGICFAHSPTDAAPQSCHLEEGGENGEEGGEEEEVEVSFEVGGWEHPGGRAGNS